jgi:predicted ATPase
VFDNCEHLVEACAALAEELPRSCPGLRILATSREPLRIPGEHVWRVPPLPAPDPRVMVTLDVLAKNPAVRLFVGQGQAIESALTLTAETSLAIAGICARVDGLPLAIELAAARAPVLAPEQILARLDDAFRRGQTGHPGHVVRASRPVVGNGSAWGWRYALSTSRTGATVRPGAAHRARRLGGDAQATASG